MKKDIEEIRSNNQLLAIIIRHSFNQGGLSFITDDENILQVGYMEHPEDKNIQPHRHKPFKRETLGTQEFIIIKKGKVRVSFYLSDETFFQESILHTGDSVLLIDGGHGFETLEPTQMLEIKNGPYAGDEDKIKF